MSDTEKTSQKSREIEDRLGKVEKTIEKFTWASGIVALIFSFAGVKTYFDLEKSATGAVAEYFKEHKWDQIVSEVRDHKIKYDKYNSELASLISKFPPMPTIIENIVVCGHVNQDAVNGWILEGRKAFLLPASFSNNRAKSSDLAIFKTPQIKFSRKFSESVVIPVMVETGIKTDGNGNQNYWNFRVDVADKTDAGFQLSIASLGLMHGIFFNTIIVGREN